MDNAYYRRMFLSYSRVFINGRLYDNKNTMYPVGISQIPCLSVASRLWTFKSCTASVARQHFVIPIANLIRPQLNCIGIYVLELFKYAT